MLRLPLIISALAVSLFGCGDDTQPQLDSVERIPLDPSVLSRASGLTGDPDTDQQFVLDGQIGIFELLPDGRLSLIWERPPELPDLTDLCSVGGGRFIAAANGDGYVVDTASGAATQHFCLEPAWDPTFEDNEHHNNAVACDLENRLIYGQPRTIPRAGDPIPFRSEIASYSLVTGEDLNWFSLPDPNFKADGMTMLPSGQLLLAGGSELTVVDPETASIMETESLARFGVRGVSAVSIDAERRLLRVIDNDGLSVVTLPFAELNLQSLP